MEYFENAAAGSYKLYKYLLNFHIRWWEPKILQNDKANDKWK